MIKESISSTTLKRLEILVNSAISYDERSMRTLRNLSGSTLGIRCEAPSLDIFIEFVEERLILSTYSDVAPDVELSGSLMSFLSAFSNTDELKSLSGTGITASGDTKLLKKLNSLANNLEIDWEAALEDVIGGIPAHLFGSAIRRTVRDISEVRQRATEGVVEIAQEELRLTPSMVEFDHFSMEVRLLSSDVERLERRSMKVLEILSK